MAYCYFKSEWLGQDPLLDLILERLVARMISCEKWAALPHATATSDLVYHIACCAGQK